MTVRFLSLAGSAATSPNPPVTWNGRDHDWTTRLTRQKELVIHLLECSARAQHLALTKGAVGGVLTRIVFVRRVLR